VQRTAIVIGAGLAGLSAADRLVGAGWDVTVLEARDRVGGRTWSDHAANGARIERGAEWVEEPQRELIGLCGRFGIPLVRAGMSYHDRRPVGGPPVPAADLVRARSAVRALLAELGDAAADLSVADALARLDVPDGVRTAFRARIECTAGTPASDLAATHLEMLATAPDDADSLRIGAGSDAPARALADELGSRVRLGEPVTGLALHTDGAQVETPQGAYAAERLILAVPLALLREAPFAAVLPPAVRTAVDGFGVAQAAKLFIPLTGPVAPQAHLDVHRDYWVWAANEGDAGPRPVLGGFAGSRPMLERLAVDAGPATWAERVGEMLPDLPLDLDGAGLQTWHDDPWARGVYSCVPPCARPDGDALRRTHGPLVLAGEHTDDVWSGYMEGAIRSGIRAASLLDPTVDPPAPAAH
jgi:monoamine oxidase